MTQTLDDASPVLDAAKTVEDRNPVLTRARVSTLLAGVLGVTIGQRGVADTV